MTLRIWMFAWGALPCAVMMSAQAQAQSWPSKPVHVIVNVAPAGTADVTARLLAPRLGEALGQPIVVENRGGGDGYVGIDAVVRAEPDGYTLLYAPGSRIMIAPHIVKRADLDPVASLVPVAPTGRISLFLMAHPNVPGRDLAGFAQYARANPGKVNYGTPGNGTAPHIAAEIFSREAGIRMTHIPYKGAGPVMQDLLGGQVDIAFDSGTGLPQVKSGKLRLLAVAASRRRADFPDAPTFEEAGFKGVDGGPHFAFYAPLRTPRAVVERLNREVAKLMQDAAVRERFEAQGLEVAPPMTPEAFAAYVRSESERYAKIIPEIGLAK
jgi:tripartite-type tricarboxylate transporter receptor subunit TctC